MMETKSGRILKNTTFLYVKMGISIFATLYSTRLVIKALGIIDFGIYNVVAAAIAMFGFFNTSMAIATQRFMNFYEGREDHNNQVIIYNVAFVLHFAIALIMGFLFVIGEPLIFSHILSIDSERIETARWVYRMATICTVTTVLGVPYDALLNAHENMFVYSIIGIIESTLKLCVALMLSYFSGDKLILYAFLILCVTILTNVSMFIYCKSHYAECVLNPRKYYDRYMMSKMTIFGGWNFVGTSSSMLSNYGAKIILNRFWGVALNAAEGVSAQVTSAMLQLSNNMMKAVNPIIVKEEGLGDRYGMFRLTFTSCKFMYLMYAVVAFPIFFECDYILKKWLVVVPPFASEYIKLVVILKFIEQITAPLHTSILAVGNVKQYNLVNAILQIFMIFLLVYFFTIGKPPYYHIITFIIVATIFAIYRMAFCTIITHMPLKIFLNEIIFRCLVITILVVMFLYFQIFLLPSSIWRFLLTVFSTIILIVLFGYELLLNERERICVNALLSTLLKAITKAKGWI